MTYWPWWGCGLALAAVPVLHWLLLSRMFAVSGRYTALVNRLRERGEPAPAMSPAELAEAMRLATLEAFGQSGVERLPQPAPDAEEAATAASPRPQSSATHVLFLLSLGVGAAISAWMAGGHDRGVPADDQIFHRIFGTGQATTAAVLLGGGLLVGFGTRMAGGCTSGHGLCGVSRFQRGSLAATAAFFGAAIALSLLLERLS